MLASEVRTWAQNPLNGDQNRAGQDKTGQDRTEQCRAETRGREEFMVSANFEEAGDPIIYDVYAGSAVFPVFLCVLQKESHTKKK